MENERLRGTLGFPVECFAWIGYCRSPGRLVVSQQSRCRPDAKKRWGLVCRERFVGKEDSTQPLHKPCIPLERGPN